MSKHSVPLLRGRRRRFAPIAIATGIAAAALLSFSMSGALAGFTATINNPTNAAASGTVLMSETGGSNTCWSNGTANGAISGNSASCATINKFGGSTTMVPGSTTTTTVAIKNTGSVTPSAFSLTPGGTCSQFANGAQNGTATDVCAQFTVVITSDVAVAGGGNTVYSGTVASLAGKSAAALSMPPAPAANGTVNFTFAVTLASGANNSYQGLGASLPLVWQFNT